jgi:hypothetical protein
MRNQGRFSIVQLCIWFCCVCLIPSMRSDRVVGAESEQNAYNIPAQDLKAALNAFAATSGLQVLYETSLVAGRVSGAVMGHHPPKAALDKLLSGTGLVGRRTDFDAVTVSLRPQERAELLSDQQRMFLGYVQAGIIAELCNGVETRSRDYRIAVQLWLTDYGTVRRAKLLSSTGSFRRDDAIAQALQRLSIGAVPPPGMRQPVTMALLPHQPGCEP